jgi:hypothetical protein
MSEAESTDLADRAELHGHDSGHDSEHAAEEPLGPVDVTTWAYALAGALLGLLVVLALYLASGA